MRREYHSYTDPHQVKTWPPDARSRCSCAGCVRHIEALERINRTLAVEVDRLQAQLDAAALRGRDRRVAA